MIGETKEGFEDTIGEELGVVCGTDGREETEEGVEQEGAWIKG